MEIETSGQPFYSRYKA